MDHAEAMGVIATGPYADGERGPWRAVMIRLGPDEYAICVELGSSMPPVYDDTEVVRATITIPDPFTLASRVFADLVVELAGKADWAAEAA